MNILEIKEDAKFSVIGVCGITGSLVARILMDHGYQVQANDMVNEEDCRFRSALDDYPDMKVYYGKTPESFFEETDYMVLPISMIESKSFLYTKTKKYNIPVITFKDIIDLFEPVHPVISITGTNGKTTTTTLLKHIAYFDGKHPCEHNLQGMQGNAEYIPALQSRLNGDLNILETGTFGYKGSITKIATPCQPDVGVFTNITPDHLTGDSTFLDYANVKGELIQLLNNKTIVVNNDDPTIKGLINKLDYQGKIITFGLDYTSSRKGTKTCTCGKTIEIDEYIAGVGRYECSCGIKYTKPDFIASNINEKHDEFTLITPNGEKHDFKLAINGIHNIYNALGAIIVAHEILNISYDTIKSAVLTFTGVSGRMEKIGVIDDKEVMVDYAHNPGGITTVLKELKNSYAKIVNVNTTSSESGMDGDDEILNSSVEYADYVIPASKSAYECAKKYLDKNMYVGKIILPDIIPDDDKEGTLGATSKEVCNAFNKALELDVDLIVCTGEAAFKFKDKLIEKL